MSSNEVTTYEDNNMFFVAIESHRIINEEQLPQLPIFTGHNIHEFNNIMRIRNDNMVIETIRK